MKVSNSVVSHNKAYSGGGGCGAGFHVVGGDVRVLDSIIQMNGADYGAGLNIVGGKVLVNNCQVSGNSATMYGAGLYLMSDGDVTLRHVTFPII